MFLYLILIAFCYIHAFIQCLNTYKGFIFLFLNLLAFVSIFNAVYFKCSIWCTLLYAYLFNKFLHINLEVANFVIFEILSIFSSTLFIGVNNIFCFFYKRPNFPPHYTFLFFQKVMTEIKLANKWVVYIDFSYNLLGDFVMLI